MVLVRYIVTNTDVAIDFYTKLLNFQLVMHPAPGFAMLTNGDLRLALSVPNAPGGGGGTPMPDGRQQEPGG
jgi:catechol 2,3-dioxygenase-like lactoylglutathione lyase family enzyme